MTRRDVIEEELEQYKAWRRKNFDYSDSVAHLRYVEYLGWQTK